jgi:hypothetical protein
MKVNFNVLNQKATPAIYAAPFVDRPAPGYVGRVFIDSDNPSTGIYRDTGTAWISLTSGGGGGGITGSGTINTIPKFTGATAIGDSVITYTAPGVGIAQSVQFGTNTVVTIAFTGAAAQPIGFYIYEAAATGFNIQRVVGAPNYNSIYSGNSDIEFKLFDGATDNYTRFHKGGNITIGSNTDAGYKLDIVGTARVQTNLVIGTTAYTGYSGSISKSITGGTIAGVFQIQSVVQNDVTNQARLFYTQPGTAAGGTLTGMYHLLLTQGTFSGSVSQQYGIYIDSSLTGATTNYGIYANIASAANRWNLYVNGTANNYISGKLLIGTTTDNGNQVNVSGTVSADGFFIKAGGITLSTNGSATLGGAANAFGNLWVSGVFPGTAVSWLTVGNNTFGQQYRKSADNNGVSYIIDNATVSVSNATILSLESTTRGFRPPRMTTAQKTAIVSPVAGLMVYDTTLNKLCVYTTAWETVTSV